MTRQITLLQPANNSKGNSEQATFRWCISGQAPVVTAERVSHTSCVLAWKPDMHISFYKIYQNGVFLEQLRKGVCSKTITGLSTFTAYTFQVIALNREGTEYASNVVNITTTGPIEISGVYTTDHTTNGFTFHWDNNPNYDGIRIKKTGTENSSDIGQLDFPAGSTTGAFYGFYMKHSSIYSFTIVGLIGGVEQPLSIYSDVFATAPEAFISVSYEPQYMTGLKNITTNSITVTWSQEYWAGSTTIPEEIHVVDLANGVDFAIAPTQHVIEEIPDTGGTILMYGEFIISGLTSGTTYNLSIYKVKNNVRSAPVTCQGTTLLGAINVNFVSSTIDSMTFSWSAPAYLVNYYELRYETYKINDNVSPPTYLNTLSVNTADGTTTTCTITGLGSYSSLEGRNIIKPLGVIAHTATAQSALLTSSQYYVTKPKPFINFTASNLLSDGMTLNWQNYTGSASPVVCSKALLRTTDDAFSYTITGGHILNYSQVATGLSPDTTYNWGVRGMIDGGINIVGEAFGNEPTYSDEVFLEAATTSIPPTQVTGLAATSTDSELTLTFNEDIYPDSYRVNIYAEKTSLLSPTGYANNWYFDPATPATKQLLNETYPASGNSLVIDAATIASWTATYLDGTLTHFTFLPDAMTMKVTVYAIKNGVESPASAVISTRLKCPAPTNLQLMEGKALEGSYAHIAVTFDAPRVNPWYEYVITATPTAGGTTTTKTTIPTEPWGDFPYLTPGTNYTFKAYTKALYDTMSMSVPSNECQGIVYPPPTAITPTQIDTPTTLTATISWATLQLVSYKVYVKVVDGWTDWTANTVMTDATTAVLTLGSSENFQYMNVEGTYYYYTDFNALVVPSNNSISVRVDAINNDDIVTTGTAKSVYLRPVGNNLYVVPGFAYPHAFSATVNNVLNHSLGKTITHTLYGKNAQTQVPLTPVVMPNQVSYQISPSDIPGNSTGQQYEVYVITTIAGNPYSTDPTPTVTCYTSPYHLNVVATPSTTSASFTWTATPGAGSYVLTFTDEDNDTWEHPKVPSQRTVYTNSATVSGFDSGVPYAIIVAPQAAPSTSVYFYTTGGGSLPEEWPKTYFTTL